MLNKLLICLLLIINVGCSSIFNKPNENKNEGELTPKKKRINPNVRERMKDSEGIIFRNNKENQGFGELNIMWKATYEALDFIPIKTASYDGGLYVTEWYSSEGSNESVQIIVRFLSSKVSAGALEVNSFKKKCKEAADCKITKGSEVFNKKIKDNILNKVREINTKN